LTLANYPRVSVLLGLTAKAKMEATLSALAQVWGAGSRASNLRG